MNPVPIDAPPAIAPKPALTPPLRADGALALRFAGRAVMAVLEMLLTWQERATQRHHLSMAEEHVLRDVGLRRADLEPEIRTPFWRSDGRGGKASLASVLIPCR